MNGWEGLPSLHVTGVLHLRYPELTGPEDPGVFTDAFQRAYQDEDLEHEYRKALRENNSVWVAGFLEGLAAAAADRRLKK